MRVEAIFNFNYLFNILDSLVYLKSATSIPLALVMLSNQLSVKVCYYLTDQLRDVESSNTWIHQYVYILIAS